MTKICIISPSFPDMNCGVADYTFRLAEALKGLGADISVVTSDNDKIKKRVQSGGFGSILVLPIIKKWGFADMPFLLKNLVDLKPDIIHIQYQWWMYQKRAMITFLPLLLKLLRKDFYIVTTFHDLMGPYLFPKAGPLRRQAVKALAIYSDKIITSTKADKETLERLLPKAADKISHIPSGAGIFLKESPLNEAGKARYKFRDAENQVLISNFGYMLPYKGLEDLLEAIKLLVEKKYPVNLLAIGGSDIENKISDTYFSDIQKKAENLGISQYIRWIGYCDPKQVSDYLLASDLCVLPYRDGVSDRRSSFIGALSHGIPIVTTKLNKAPEKIVDHYNVLLVEPNNPGQLAEAIEELINSSELRQKLANAAKKLYDKEYSWEVISGKTLEVYKNLSYA